MQWILLFLAFAALSACRKPSPAPKTVHLRLDILAGKIRCGTHLIPSDPASVSSHLWSVSQQSAGDLELEFLFDGGSPSERAGIIFSAAADAGVLREDVQLPFNVAGRCGDPFMLERIEVRCCSRRYLDSNDDLAISACPNTTNEWVQLDLQWQQEALKFEGRSTDEDELRTRLRELRQIFRGVFVLISVPGDTTLNDLVPVLEICQSTGCSMDLSFQSITERQRLLGRMISSLPLPKIPAQKNRAL
ncbi:MAG TPA: hypothetical protein VHM91_20530 [Verrucomicrobiales bacterium]|nr:hypothetical protein [Verrucomicrobiales bacterium]